MVFRNIKNPKKSYEMVLVCNSNALCCLGYSGFAAECLAGLSPAHLEQYDDIINKPDNDWQLYYWMIGETRGVA